MKDNYKEAILISLYEHQDHDSEMDAWMFLERNKLHLKPDKKVERALKGLQKDKLIEKKDDEEYKINEDRIDEIKKAIKPYLLLGGIEGKGKPDNHERIEFLKNLLNNSLRSAEIIENQRWKNLNFSIIVFAALFALHFQLNNPLIVTLSLSFIMLLFFLNDNRLHRFVHGYRVTIWKLNRNITNIINQPTKDLVFWGYYVKGELQAKAQGFTARRIIYIFLVIIPIITLCLKLIYPNSDIFQSLNLFSKAKE